MDWTKAWSTKYPVLATYQKEVDIPKYAAEMLNGLKPYNYLTYVMERMKEFGPFPEKEAMRELLPWSNSLPADCHSKLKK